MKTCLCIYLAAIATPALASSLPPVTFILDASYSMDRKIEGGAGETRFEALKDILRSEIPAIPADQPVGLAAFGVNRGCSEENTPVLLEPQAGNESAVLARALDLKIGSTSPFTLSMQKNVQLATGILVPIRRRRMGSTELARPADGRVYQEPRADAPMLIYITDGRDSCEADPCQFVKDVAELGLNVRIRFIGVGVDGFEAARNNLACMQQFPNFVGGRAKTKGEVVGLVKKILDGRHDDELRAQALAMPYQRPKVETHARGVILPASKAAPAPEPVTEEPIEPLRAPPALLLEPSSAK